MKSAYAEARWQESAPGTIILAANFLYPLTAGLCG